MIKQEDSYKAQGKRRALVKIIEKKGIKDPKVLNAIGTVPRHFFFDPAFIEHAYQDKAFPIGEEQTISQPYTVAFQTELLELKGGEKVLEIGTGSGYQACVLHECGTQVFTIEYNRILFNRTRKVLPQIGYKLNLSCGDGTLGWPSQAPFDGILVTAGAPSIPSTLINQLKVGGRLVIPVGKKRTQSMVRITRQSESKLVKENFSDFAFVPLLGKKGWTK